MGETARTPTWDVPQHKQPETTEAPGSYRQHFSIQALRMVTNGRLRACHHPQHVVRSMPLRKVYNSNVAGLLGKEALESDEQVS